MSKQRQKGTLAETALIGYLRDNGFGGAERRALHGAHDQGDVTGTPGICWEVKNHKRYAIPEWLDETADEAHNADADHGILIVKPNGVGTTRVGDWWAILTVDQVVQLLRQAGYGDAL